MKVGAEEILPYFFYPNEIRCDNDSYIHIMEKAIAYIIILIIIPSLVSGGLIELIAHSITKQFKWIRLSISIGLFLIIFYLLFRNPKEATQLIYDYDGFDDIKRQLYFDAVRYTIFASIACSVLLTRNFLRK